VSVTEWRLRAGAVIFPVLTLVVLGRFFVSLGRHDGDAGSFALLAVFTSICSALLIRWARRT